MYRDFYLQTIIYTILTVQVSRCQEWTWLGGDKIINRLSTSVYPGGRSGSSVWSSNGTVWMFGGKGFSDLGSGDKSQFLNDVWTFNIHTKQFKLQNPGSWTLWSDPVMYSTVVPLGRQHAAMCGNLDKIFVFGGFSKGGVSFGDLWSYDISSRKWLELHLSNDSSAGPSARGHSSVWCYESSMYLFGGMNNNKTVFAEMWMLNLSSLTWTNLHVLEESDNLSSLSYPAGRNGAATWISCGILYMFGGNTDSSFSYTLPRVAGLTSDLWEYHIKSNTWQFISGITQSGQHLVNGTDTIADTYCSNIPNSRLGSAAWTDSDGSLWLFGGAGADNHPIILYNPITLFSDLWRFNLDTQCWAFVGGSDSGETSGRYGDLGKAATTNLPGARTETMVWIGGDNLIYLFGGLGHDGMHFSGYLNDLWCADFSREHMVTPGMLLSFFGVASLLLVAVLVIALCSRQKPLRHGSRLQFKLIPEYYRLDSEVI